MSTSLHANRLRRSLRNVVLATLAAPLPPIAVAACGGSVEPGSVEATEAGSGSSAAGPCRVRERLDPRVLCGKEPLLELVGDLNTCPFEDGVEKAKFCSEACGVTTCNRVGNSVRCIRPCAVEGRGYANLDDADAPSATSTGSYLARMAFYEAVSVDAFTLLARDLKALGAPDTLVRACREARRDEVRHRRMASALARRHDADAPAPPPPIPGARDLEALAIENAVEGCVRESFGVLVGMWQSRLAPTAELRAFFAAVTHDELRHAALSARIDAWALARLSVEARRRVEAARSRALAELEASFLAWHPVAGLGLPSATQVRELFGGWRTATVPRATQAA